MDSEPPALRMIRGTISVSSNPPAVVRIAADRWQLAKLRWRAAADDGTEFGFDLHTPLRHGDAVWETPAVVYRIEQRPEPVIVIPFDSAAEAAELAWNIGNLHQPVQAAQNELVTVDDPGIRQLLDKKHIRWKTGCRVFEPVRAMGVHGHHHHHH